MQSQKDQSQMPSPEIIFETVTAYQRSAAIKAAVELDVFTAIGEGNATADQIAKRCGTAQRGARILCDYLTLSGFLIKTDDKYSLTQESAVFLNRNSPAYLGSVTDFLLSPTVTGGFENLTEAVRNGGTPDTQGGTVAPENPIWIKFAQAMANLMRPTAAAIAQLIDPEADRELKILDIAAGHGAFGIAFLSRNPKARVAAVDWPAVLEVAEENARAAGVADRHSKIPGSAFDVDFGTGYDVVLVTNFLHHFDIPTNEKLLKKIRASLAEGGRAVTLEFVPNEDRVSPANAAGFSLTMLAGTPSGDAYTYSEIEKMFSAAGFSRSEHLQIPPSFQSLIVSYK